MDHPSPERREPGEDLDAGGHRDQHRRDHHRHPQPAPHAGHEHVVRPDREPEDHDRHQREGHHPVAEDRLAGVGRDDLADDPEARQHHDVDGRVRVEPEDVLVHQHVAARRRVEEVGADRAVEQHEELRAGDERRGDHDQQRGREVRPHQQRHAPERHARRAHGDDRDQEVERGGDRRGARELHADREELLAERRLGGERGVGRPAGGEGAALGEEASTASSRRPTGSIQNDSAFRRGNAMSGAPIISGIT